MRAGYHVGALLGADVIVHLIGERPGTGLDTLSAYLTYGRDRAGQLALEPRPRSRGDDRRVRHPSERQTAGRGGARDRADRGAHPGAAVLGRALLNRVPTVADRFRHTYDDPSSQFTRSPGSNRRRHPLVLIKRLQVLLDRAQRRHGSARGGTAAGRPRAPQAGSRGARPGRVHPSRRPARRRGLAGGAAGHRLRAERAAGRRARDRADGRAIRVRRSGALCRRPDGEPRACRDPGADGPARQRGRRPNTCSSRSIPTWIAAPRTRSASPRRACGSTTIIRRTTRTAPMRRSIRSGKRGRTIDDRGWTAELWVPFSQLRFNEQGDLVWGLNLRRWTPTLNEQEYWVAVRRTEQGWASRFGELRGLEGVRPPPPPRAAALCRRIVARHRHPRSANPFDDGFNGAGTGRRGREDERRAEPHARCDGASGFRPGRGRSRGSEPERQRDVLFRASSVFSRRQSTARRRVRQLLLLPPHRCGPARAGRRRLRRLSGGEHDSWRGEADRTAGLGHLDWRARRLHRRGIRADVQPGCRLESRRRAWRPAPRIWSAGCSRSSAVRARRSACM